MPKNPSLGDLENSWNLPRAVRDRIHTEKERMIETCAETHGETCEDDEFRVSFFPARDSKNDS